MKRKLWPPQLKLIFVAALVVLANVPAFAQGQPWSQNTSPLPAPTGFVNDYAGVIDAATKQQLETKLKTLKDTTSPSVEIAVVTVKTTGDRDIFDYSLSVARGWKIGSKDDDNPSALLFVAIDDRKYFTQVSKDLEDELPDGIVGSLQRQYLVPEFKKANYGKGIADTVDAYITTIRNKGNAPVAAPTPQSGTTRQDEPMGNVICGFGVCFFIILIIVISLISRGRGGPSNRDRDRWGGGGFGGGSAAGNIASAVIGGIIGSALSGGSSSSGSSDWGGSSSGGGDFGGFGGGGDFGGGGSGGSW